MQRGSDRLSVHKDEEMKHELQGLIRSGHPTRVEEWHDPEPVADDDPRVASGPVRGGEADGDPLRPLRFELARHLGRKAFPADARRVRAALRAQNAPDELVELVRGLPDGTVFHSVGEVAEALSGGPAAA
jgi:hypothetical protein